MAQMTNRINFVMTDRPSVSLPEDCSAAEFLAHKFLVYKPIMLS